jgi:hypothetical protein
MWNFVWADKANRALSAQTKFQIQKCNTCRVLEIRSRALSVNLGSKTHTNLGHNPIEILKKYAGIVFSSEIVGP